MKKKSNSSKNNWIVIKMVKRDKDDPNYNDSGASQNVFQIVQVPEDDNLTQEQIDKKNNILSQFSQKELGKYDIEKAKKKRMLKELQDQQLYPEEFKDQLEGKDLWIHHLHQQKLEKLKEEMENDEEFNENLGQYEDIEIEEEEYDLEDNDEDFEDIDEENEDDEEVYEIQNEKLKSQNKKIFQDDGDWQDLNQQKKETKQEISNKINNNNNKQTNLIQRDEETKGEFKKKNNQFQDDEEEQDEEKRERQRIAKQLELNEQELKKNYKLNPQQLKLLENDEFPDYNKLQFSENIKMKKFNEFGLPADDGYDYSQHVIKNNAEGDMVSIFKAVYTQPPKLEPNLDYMPEEMTNEQKEVFESLNFQEQEGAYEELEDDFIMMAQEGEECIKENKMLTQQQENKKNDENQKQKKVVRFADLENKEKEQNLKNNNPIKNKKQKQIEKQIIQKKGKKPIEGHESSEEEGETKQQPIQPNYKGNLFQRQDLFQIDQLQIKTNDKINNNKQLITQKQKEQRDSEDEQEEFEDNLEDEEIDEAQIQQAMLEFEACEQATHKLNLDQNTTGGVSISKDLFNNILNEHLEEMKERQNGNNNNLEIKKTKTTMKNVDKILEMEKKILNKESNQKQQKKFTKNLEDQKKEEQEENEAEEQQEIERNAKHLKSNYQKLLDNIQGKYVSKYDQQMEFYKKYAEYFKEQYGETFVPPTTYGEVPLEKDYVLQKIIEQGDSSGEDVANMENEFENRVEQFEETIATKEFNTSTVHLNLNIVKEQIKKNHKQSIDIKSQQQLEIEENQKSYEQKQFKLFETLNQIQPRNKNETKEEKKQRKQLVKEFKNLRKEKNKEFKEGFNKMKQEKVAKVNNQTNSQALRGVSVYQI